MQDVPGPGHLVPCAMSQQEKLVGLERRLILHDAVLGNAYAIQPRAERAQSAHHNGAFQRADDPGDQRTGYQYRPEARNNEESGSEQHPPETTPEGALFAPVLHAVTGVIVSDDVLVGMIILADDGHFLHVKPRPLQFLHGFVCLGVGFINGYYRVRFNHDLRSSLSKSLALPTLHQVRNAGVLLRSTASASLAVLARRSYSQRLQAANAIRKTFSGTKDVTRPLTEFLRAVRYINYWPSVSAGGTGQMASPGERALAANGQTRRLGAVAAFWKQPMDLDAVGSATAKFTGVLQHFIYHSDQLGRSEE